MGRARAESRTTPGPRGRRGRIYIAAVPLHPGAPHRSMPDPSRGAAQRRPRATRSKRTIARPSSAMRASGFHA
jgi:hypothetical protein